MSQRVEEFSMPEPGKVPPKVAAIAGQYRLGGLVAVTTGHNPFKIVGFAVGLFVAGIGVAALGAFVRFLFVLGLAVMFFGFVAIAFAVKVAAAGVEASYVYSGGFVVRKKRDLRAVTWPEVTQLRRVRAGTVMPAHPLPDSTMFHKAVLRDGTQLDVGGDKVAPRVEEIAVAASVPVSG
jgi:hypothetical protein